MNMPNLSAQQMLAVQHGTGTDQEITCTLTPEGLTLITPHGVHIDVIINDGGVKTEPEYSVYIQCCLPDHPALDTLAGYCEVYQRTDLIAWDPVLRATVPVLCSPLLWFYRQQSHGGATGSIGYPSRSHALSGLIKQIWHHVKFWESKLILRDNGDMTIVPRHRRRTDRPERVIRCGGIHYTLGPEPSSHDERTGLGHGGAEFVFRMLATGERILSHNVWHQGRIPSEYQTLLPDNAAQIPS